MGIIRNLGKWLLGSVLVISIILTIFLIGFVKLSEYENMRSASFSFLESMLKTKVSYEDISAVCKIRESIEFTVQDIGNVSVPCNEIKEDDYTRPFVYAVFDKIYYKQYDCQFLECIKHSPLVVLSAHANAFLKSIELYMILGTFLFMVLYLLSVENMKERLKGLGSILSFCGIQFFLTSYLLNVMHLDEFKFILDPLFSQIYVYFAVTAASGIILLLSSFFFNKKL